MFKKFSADVLLYGLSAVITRAISILFTPIYTRVFHPSDYGVLSIVNSTFYLIAVAVGFGLDYASSRFFFEHQDEAYKKKVMSNWFFFQLLCSALAFGVVVIGGSRLTLYMLETTDDFRLLLIPALGLIFYTWVCMLQNLYRFQQKARKVALFTIFYGLFNVGITALFILYLKQGLIGFLVGQLSANLVFGIMAAIELRHWLQWKFIDFGLLKKMLRFSLPIVPTTLAFGGLTSIGIFFINRYLDKTAVGIFSIGSSLASVLSFVTTAFQLAWGPFYLSKLNDPNLKDMIRRFFTYFVVVCNALWLILCLFTPEALYVLTTPNYYGAGWVAPLLSLNFIFYGYSFFTKVGSDIAKNSVPLSIGMALAAAFSILGFFLLIPIWGINGAALAISAGQLLIPAYVNWRSQKVYPISFDWGFIVFHSGLFFASGYIGRFLTGSEVSLWSIVLKLLILAVLVGATLLVLGRRYGAGLDLLKLVRKAPKEVETNIAG